MAQILSAEEAVSVIGDSASVAVGGFEEKLDDKQ